MVVSSSSSSNRNSRDRIRRFLLGFGFWVQGMRCLPWLAINFFLKDGLLLDSSTLQILQNSANLPMVAKPFYGILSDSLYINGQHRLPYIAFGGTYTHSISLSLYLYIYMYTSSMISSLFAIAFSTNSDRTAVRPFWVWRKIMVSSLSGMRAFSTNPDCTKD